MTQVLDRAGTGAKDKAGMSNVVTGRFQVCTLPVGGHFIVADHVVKHSMYEGSWVPSANNFTQTLISEYRAHSNVEYFLIAFGAYHVLTYKIMLPPIMCQSLVCNNVSFRTKKTFFPMPNQQDRTCKGKFLAQVGYIFKDPRIAALMRINKCITKLPRIYIHTSKVK